MSQLVDRARAKATLAIMSRGSEIPVLVSEEIPSVEAYFLDTKDKWVEINFPYKENVTACLYKAKKGSESKPHIHEKSLEHIVILNPEGKIKVVTEDGIEYVEYPNGVIIKAGTAHALSFREDSEILVMWHPRMSSVHVWEAKFVTEDEFK
jgi:quercetin dioxygenase-like cupin family protein